MGGPDSDYRRSAPLDLLLQAAVLAVLTLMPFSVLFPFSPPLVPGILALYVTPGFELADIPALILLQLAGLDAWLEAQHGARPRRRPWVFATIALFIALLGAASATAAFLPPLALYTALRWLLAAALVWAIARAAVPPRRMALVLALVLGFHSLVALLQVINNGPLGLPGELVQPLGRRGSNVVHLGDRLALRGYGLTFHPNVLGGFLAVALLLLVPLLARRPVQLLWCFLAVGLVTTLSRSAMLGLGLTILPLAWWLGSQDRVLRRAFLQFGAVLAALILLSAPLWWKPIVTRLEPALRVMGIAGVAGERAARAESGSLRSRTQMNRLAARIIADHPLLGIGAGNFPVAMLGQSTSDYPQYVHNVALLLGAEVGIFGLLAWLAIPLWAALRWWRGPRTTWLAVAVAACWAIAIISLFDSYTWALTSGRLLTVTVLALLESSLAVRRVASAAEQG